MTVTPGFTADEIRGFIAEYEALPYGTKTAWVEGQPFSVHQMRRWRQAHFEGSLDRGLVPQKGRAVSRTQALAQAKAATEKAVRVQKESEARIAALEKTHRLELAERDAQIRMLEAGNVTLGKAIGFLQSLGLQEPGNTQMSKNANTSSS